MAANRSGKSYACSYEVSRHAERVYPDWWEGYRFSRPISILCAAPSYDLIRKSAQKHLLGGTTAEERGTGLIARDSIREVRMVPGVPDCVRTVWLHNGNVIEFQVYEQGRDKFQAYTVDLAWLDEEPRDPKIFTEILTRTATIPDGKILMSFTPLFGLSEVALKFTDDGLFPSDNVNKLGNWVGNISWVEEIPHLEDKVKKELLSNYDEAERDARAKGIPSLGSGLVYPVSWDKISCEPFKIPDWWLKSGGMDVGWRRTACVWCAQDPTTKVWYIYHEYYGGKEDYTIHARNIRMQDDKAANWMWFAIDPRSDKAAEKDGEKLLVLYREEGLNLRQAHNAIKSGLARVRGMLEAGTLKVFNNLTSFRKEILTYRRDEKGNLVGEDHLMDAMKYWADTGINLAISKDEALAKYDNQLFTDPTQGRDTLTGY